MHLAPAEMLAARAAAGDHRAADKLARETLEKFTPLIRAWARRIDPAEARSLAGEAILRAFRSWQPGDFFGGHFAQHFQSLCMTRARGDRRRITRDDRYHTENLAGRTAEIDETASDAGRVFKLAERVLTPTELLIFNAARATDQLSEIAGTLGVSRQYVSKIYHSALLKLRAALDAAREPETA
jgi:DNA-directed RNA polymerase specialized sigma24 family protein